MASTGNCFICLYLLRLKDDDDNDGDDDDDDDDDDGDGDDCNLATNRARSPKWLRLDQGRASEISALPPPTSTLKKLFC